MPENDLAQHYNLCLMKNKIRTLVFALFVTFINFAQQTSSGLLEVTGMAICEELPEELVISIPIVIVDSTYVNCSKELNFLLNELKADLLSKGFGQDAFHTGGYSVSEHYEYRQGERIRSGYKGQVTVSLQQKYEPALIDDFLKTAQKYKTQYTIGFILSEEQKDKLSKRAMEMAVEDATSKAKVLSKASGVRLNDIARISYGDQPGRPGPLVQVKSMASSYDQVESNGLKLYPGEISVNQSVLMVWNIAR